jgi:hypothetical protein
MAFKMVKKVNPAEGTSKEVLYLVMIISTEGYDLAKNSKSPLDTFP